VLNVFEVGPTYSIGLPATEPFYFQTAFDPTTATWNGIQYPGSAFPMGLSVAEGVNTLTAKIQATPGPFVLIGTSQGAMVISEVYNKLRTTLSARRADLLGAFSIGNPCRQQGVILPGGHDPGGHGIAAQNLLTNTEALWWEVANTEDMVCACPSNSTGDILSAAFYFLMTEFHDVTSLLKLVTQPALSEAVKDLYITLTSPSGHSYGEFQPLGDGRTTVQVGTAYINSLA
jgi:PE-PPE domain